MKEVKIAAHQLLRSTACENGELYAVPIELATKAWIDIEAFVAAYIAALDLYAGE